MVVAGGDSRRMMTCFHPDRRQHQRWLRVSPVTPLYPASSFKLPQCASSGPDLFARLTTNLVRNRPVSSGSGGVRCARKQFSTLPPRPFWGHVSAMRRGVDFPQLPTDWEEDTGRVPSLFRERWPTRPGWYPLYGREAAEKAAKKKPEAAFLLTVSDNWELWCKCSG